MKKTFAIVALLAVIVVCLAIAFRNLATVEDDGYRSNRERQILKKFDKDGDGELNKGERMAVKKVFEDREKEFIKKFDSNRDGALSKEEKMAAEKASRKGNMDVLKRPDRDGNPSEKPQKPIREAK